IANEHFTAERLEDAEKRLEQGRLAAAIGAEQSKHFPLLYAYVKAASDHTVAIADAQRTAGERHDQFRCMPASSQMKKGVPITAVRMPSGTSMGAMVRASVSMNSRNPPPSSAEVGSRRGKSGPTRPR